MVKKQNEKIKEDFGVVIKTPNEKFWDEIIEKAEADIKNLKDAIKINEAMIEIARVKRND